MTKKRLGLRATVFCSVRNGYFRGPQCWFADDGDLVIGGLSIGHTFHLNRRDARLLAKRINQALDAWRKAK